LNPTSAPRRSKRSLLRSNAPFAASTRSCFAETERALIGHVEATGGEYRRNRCTAYIVIGVLAAASGRGVGGALLDALDQWAAAAAVHRLELTVMASNQHALRLYERKGFLNEGRRRACLSIGGDSVDEFYMGKVLPFAT
jgi:RimJ/RimL family protein N-acetyltransferase